MDTFHITDGGEIITNKNVNVSMYLCIQMTFCRIVKLKQVVSVLFFISRRAANIWICINWLQSNKCLEFTRLLTIYHYAVSRKSICIDFCKNIVLLCDWLKLCRTNVLV